MAKDQYLSRHQKGIVNRYYSSQDARVTIRLQELVSDLYVTTGEAALKRKWDAVARELEKTNADSAAVAKAILTRDLAKVASIIAAKGFEGAKAKPPSPAVNDTDDV